MNPICEYENLDNWLSKNKLYIYVQNKTHNDDDDNKHGCNKRRRRQFIIIKKKHFV